MNHRDRGQEIAREGEREERGTEEEADGQAERERVREKRGAREIESKGKEGEKVTVREADTDRVGESERD